jgi:enoyl-CoA hydratase/carnithine racemase
MSRYESYRFLKIEVSNRVATVTLNRPEVRNAANGGMLDELRSIWIDLADDREVNAVVLTGAGESFCVGGDINQMAGGDFGKEGEVVDFAQGLRMINGLLDLDKPIVCALNGDAVGLGASLALLCDIAVMAEEGRIGDPHVRMGLVAGDGGVLIWPLLMGVNRAKEYLMRGLLIKAVEAERLGLVNHVAPRAEVYPRALEIAQELADGATWAIRWTKLSINALLKERANLTQLSSLGLEHVAMHTQDHREAARAFKEKRKPQFTGR